MDKGKKHATETVKPVRNLKQMARQRAAEQEMLAAMWVLEKQAGGLILEKTIGTIHKESSVWDVSPRDLEMLNQKLSLSQLSVVPETTMNMAEEPASSQKFNQQVNPVQQSRYGDS